MTSSADPPEQRSDRATADDGESFSISAVVPTYNDARRLGEALTSIVAQTLAPAEVIVADDASDDGTAEVVSAFAREQAKGIPVSYVRLEQQSGVVAARNAGIASAKHAWIANCDSDDVWASNKLERQIAFVRGWSGRRRLVLLGSHGYNMADAGRVISPVIMGPATEAQFEEARRRGRLLYLIHSSTLFRRADFEAVGGYTTEYGAADDFEFFCRMAALGVVISLPEQLVYYRKRAGSVQLRRFWDQQEGVVRLAENERRRARGQAPLDREAFARQRAAEPLRKRLQRRRRVLGKYYYRQGATNAVNGRRVRGIVQLVLGGALDASRFRSGIRRAMRRA